MKYVLYLLICTSLFSQKIIDPEMTMVWEPIPEIVTPGNLYSPPSDAIVLFDGTDLSQWSSAASGEESEWILNDDGSMTVKKGSGIETKEEFGSVQLHIEWKTPAEIEGEGQGRGNSGIYFQKEYEIQILDSYENVTYSNGQAASVYKQSIPLVNASRPPGEWQIYDIIFNEPVYDDQGFRLKKGTFTVFHNGVLVQNNVEIQGTTEHTGKPKLRNIKTLKKLYLQDHSNPVSFRNIWLRKL
ncbi:MAG: hypothetical protein CBD72_03370 [Flavobacteriaceae bacterium TMED212]|nr:MAG: hypothetical protein CBD72_03370 [Flavobacteriaceae bacterium TMED212]